MRVFGSRRAGVITLAVAGVAFAGAAALAVAQLIDRPVVGDPSPGPGESVGERRPLVSFTVEGGLEAAGLRVEIDGREVTGRLRERDGRLAVRAPGALADGPHLVSVRHSSGNIFARTVSRSWEFEVDTHPPRLAVATPRRGALIARRAVVFAGRGEPGARVRVSVGDRARGARVGADGRWRLVARVPDGRAAPLVSASDAAGNTTDLRRPIRVDTTAPRVAIASPGRGEVITATDRPLLRATVGGEDPRSLWYSASVNGAVVARARGADLPTADEYGADRQPLRIEDRGVAIDLGVLRQGRNRVVLAVRDRAGNLHRATTVLRVDSSEDFGEAQIARGAQGEDVRALQRRLREVRVYPRRARITGVVDATTTAAITRYQRRFGLPQTGIVDERTRVAMIGRLVVHVGTRKLRLIRDGKVWKVYEIAVGQPAYPTPLGEFHVNDKQVDPYWYPPDSPWAAELSTIPPGPGNPLGTRWIGTTATAIGIHGTYADYSIGTAASHGCMRMHIGDVEELFEQVSLGMPISIRA